MATFLNILLIITGAIFTTTVMLMSPKGGIGFAIGGAAASTNEYGSKKSIEHTFKKAAYISGIAFVVLCLLYPYISGING